MNAATVTPTLLQYAQRYHAAGLSVLPIARGEKRPAVTWEQYQIERPPLAMVNQWFSNGAYDALGIVSGDVSDGLVILDFDGDGWERARDDLIGAFPDLSNTRHVKTGSGKLHVWLKADDLSNGDGSPVTRRDFKRDDLGAHVEVRANKVQTLAPPSRHPSGGVYEFSNQNDVLRLPDLHPLLDWLAEWQAIPTQQTTPTKEKRQAPTDDELARRWLERAGPLAYGLGDWRRYAGGCWQPIPEDSARAEVLTIVEGAKFEGVRPTSARVFSVMELARLLAFVPDERWNGNAGALVLSNGVLDLATFTLRDHDPADFATVALPFGYDPTATAAHFDYAVYSTIPEAAEFLQEFAGYCLTDDTSLETAVWFYGPPASGKSTILHGLTTMLGGMAGLLGLADVERNRFALAGLPGKRLVIATEQPALYLSSAWLLNAIISGEPVTVEAKFKPAYTITPYTKLAWAMNELPRVGDASSGLFRRVHVIAFPALAADARLPELKALIGDEGAGILNWALAGLQRLRERGRFDPPACVKQANADFQKQNDKAALFVEECGLTGNEYRTKSSALYEAYKTWCFTNGHKPESSTSMAREWERLGFERSRERDGSWWTGVGLRA